MAARLGSSSPFNNPLIRSILTKLPSLARISEHGDGNLIGKRPLIENSTPSCLDHQRGIDNVGLLGSRTGGHQASGWDGKASAVIDSIKCQMGSSHSRPTAVREQLGK